MPDVYKMINATKEEACRTAEADAIRAKTGESADIAFDFANDKGFADAIANIETGGGIDALLYTSTAPRFGYRYPSEDVVLNCPLVSEWVQTFKTLFREPFPYKSITLISESVSGMDRTFNAYGPTPQSPLETITLDFGDLSKCQNYNSTITDHPNLKEIKGIPLDFSNISIVSYSEWIKTSGGNVLAGVKAQYKANTLHVNHSISTVKFTDDTMVSIANGLQAGAHTITLHADMKANCQTIMGTVSQVTEGDVTYDFFTASSSGTVTLENFITQTKGWTIA